jgi:hypothetical protein
MRSVERVIKISPKFIFLERLGLPTITANPCDRGGGFSYFLLPDALIHPPRPPSVYWAVLLASRAFRNFTDREIKTHLLFIIQKTTRAI